MILFRGKTSPKEKAIFIHIPKTGGTYLSHKANGNLVLANMNYLNHSYFVTNAQIKNPLYEFTNPEMAGKMIFLKNKIHVPVFSVVRNIFDFLVSYAGHAGGWNPKYLNVNHYDYLAAQKGFEYLLKTIINREDKWPNRKFIFFQLFSDDGDLMVDRILRNESLDEDVQMMSQDCGMEYQKAERNRLGVRAEYQKYYTPELIQLVEKTWARELLLFGYSFESIQSNLKDSVLPKIITSEMKSNVKYELKNDRLIINGTIRN